MKFFPEKNDDDFHKITIKEELDEDNKTLSVSQWLFQNKDVLTSQIMNHQCPKEIPKNPNHLDMQKYPKSDSYFTGSVRSILRMF